MPQMLQVLQQRLAWRADEEDASDVVDVSDAADPSDLVSDSSVSCLEGR